MNTGKYRHLITVQSKTASTDDYGGAIFTWADVCTAWAMVLPMTVRGRELVTNGAEQHEAMVRFYVRYMVGGIDASMRIVWQGKYHDIVSVADIKGEGRELEILAKVGANVG